MSAHDAVRKISKEVIRDWRDLVFYISQLAVNISLSVFSPVCIVFN